ncbi:hypothetical protein AAC03nite_02240 [Alicyclobacillus acidoterrestris]|uniref:hypothetical protein n=1 Tax=Alicyclobacillus suci TaxID=2816080 RepID=UPI0011946FC4|nr:hypothetical protein [Alicyclobacillus suci]GEO24439.1 hypothetical protein AAC03nite_02240 [Alicyclobacillus acidoterrestris]
MDRQAQLQAAQLNEAADYLVMNAIDTIRERMQDDDAKSRLTALEDAYLNERPIDLLARRQWLENTLSTEEAAWPLRLYLADVALQEQNEASFEQEVSACLTRLTDLFVVVSLFMFITRLYVLRAPTQSIAAAYVRETMTKNPSIAPYIRSIYIQTLLDAEDFESAYEQLQLAVEENNSMLTIEGLEILPILLARLGKWSDAARVKALVGQFAREQVSEAERSEYVERLLVDVQEREQLGDFETARFLMDVAKEVDDQHPAVKGYLSIGVQMPKGWWPVQ